MFLTQMEGWTLLLVFAAMMLVAVWFLTKHGNDTIPGFLVADRQVGLFRGAFSIAVTFIWAPAIFVCALQSFTSGVPGIFWFMFPNFLCLILSGFLAVRIRRLHPDGFTLTEFLANRLGANGKPAHIALLLIFFLWMLMAIVINCAAGGAMLATLSGIDYRLAALGLALTALSYSLISGMRASVLTDMLQMILILGIVFVIVPTVIGRAGGTELLASGIGGLEEKSVNPFDLGTMYSVGILAFVGLFGGWMQDQTYYQRVFALKKHLIIPSFVIAAFVFAIVPITLSLLGFVGAGLVEAGELAVDPKQNQMIGPIVVASFMSKFGLMLFALMAFAGLASTLDSAFCAISSLASIDIYKRYVNRAGSDRQAIRAARIGMIAIGLIGVLISFLNPPILWLFLTYAAIAVGGLAPVLFIIFGRPPRSGAIVTSVVLALAISMPSAIYGHIVGNTHLVVWGTLGAFALSAGICFFANSSAKVAA